VRRTPGEPAKLLFNSVVGHPATGRNRHKIDEDGVTLKEIGLELDMPQLVVVPTVGEDRDGALYVFWKSADAVLERGAGAWMASEFTKQVQAIAKNPGRSMRTRPARAKREPIAVDRSPIEPVAVHRVDVGGPDETVVETRARECAA